jgi:hypothetical protein
VKKEFEGSPDYIGEFSVEFKFKDGCKRWHPCAVYRSNNPNRSKGHKDYLLLWSELINPVEPELGRRTIISGMDDYQMEEFRYQEGVHCEKCNEVIYSVDRHDYKHCECGDCMIDGGRDYTRRSASGRKVVIDLLKMEVIDGDTEAEKILKEIQNL